MKYNLFITYWSSPDTVRNKEILDTIEKNIQLNVFDTITIFTESESKKDIKNIKDVEIIVDSRKTYQDIFDYSNLFFNDDELINILANSDIEFTDTIKLLDKINKNDFIALTRYNRETNNLERSNLNEVSDTQDVWIWRGKTILTNCKFYLGVPGCDNKIAFKAFDTGYDVRNPSKSVVTYHNHLTNSRPGTSTVSCMRVERPYCYLKPTTIDEEYILITEELKATPINIRVEENQWKAFKNNYKEQP